MAYVRVLGGIAVLGGGFLAYAAVQSRHVGFSFTINFALYCIIV